MNPAIASLIIEGVASLAPYVAQLGSLAVKLRQGERVTDDDLAEAEAARARAFAALRRELGPSQAGNAGP